MLQTNPMTPTKAPAASGAHSFMKASSPLLPPLSAIVKPSIWCPWPLGGKWRGRAGWAPMTRMLDAAAHKEGAPQKVWRERKEM